MLRKQKKNILYIFTITGMSIVKLTQSFLFKASQFSSCHLNQGHLFPVGSYCLQRVGGDGDCGIRWNLSTISYKYKKFQMDPNILGWTSKMLPECVYQNRVTCMGIVIKCRLMLNRNLNFMNRELNLLKNNKIQHNVLKSC